MDRVPDAPTADLLLDVWTPGELALSPDGSRMAFALHATVAEAPTNVRFENPLGHATSPAP